MSAVAIATRPWRALSPGALAMDKLVTNLRGLVAFLEGAAAVSPAEARLLLGPSAGALSLIADSLSALQGALAGNVGLLGALNDAAGVLGFVEDLGGDAVTSLIGTAVGAIGQVLSA